MAGIISNGLGHLPLLWPRAFDNDPVVSIWQGHLPYNARGRKTKIMEIIALSLKPDEARRKRLADSLAPFGLGFHWLEGIDARGWTPQEARRHMDRKSVFCNIAYEPNPGAVGCYLSHLKAFEYLLNSDQEALIILEDDAQISDEFAKSLPCLAMASKTLDVIFLNDCRPERPSQLIGTCDQGLAFHFKRYANIGAFGYVINRKAASFMVERHARFGLEIDTLLNRWWQSGLHVATTGTNLVHHDFMGTTIGYENVKPTRNPLRHLITKLFRASDSVTKRMRYNPHLTLMKTTFEKARSQ